LVKWPVLHHLSNSPKKPNQGRGRGGKERSTKTGFKRAPRDARLVRLTRHELGNVYRGKGPSLKGVRGEDRRPQRAKNETPNAQKVEPVGTRPGRRRK